MEQGAFSYTGLSHDGNTFRRTNSQVQIVEDMNNPLAFTVVFVEALGFDQEFSHVASLRTLCARIPSGGC